MTPSANPDERPNSRKSKSCPLSLAKRRENIVMPTQIKSKSFDRYAPLDHPRGLRQCSKCGSWLPLEAFERGSCRDCVNKLREEERERDRKRYQASRSAKLKGKRAYDRKKPSVSRSF